MPSGKASESRAFQSPSRYIQGPGEIRNLPKFAAQYGKTALAMIDSFFYPEYSQRIPRMFEEAGMTAWTVEFPGAASNAVLDRMLDFCRTLPQIPDTFIGIGGGQTCDINKAMGATFGKAFFSVPTALTTDAPTSTHTVFHNPHQQPQLMVHYKNPDYVVVDTEITVQSPAWMLVSGIGDALATYVEAQASFANNNVCNAGAGDYRPTLLGMAAAKLSYDILLEKGRDAMLSARNHLRTPAYEDVVEATVLLSGLGFECTGVSIAHGLEAGFHVLPVKPLLHGTGVGYCTLVMLVIQNDTQRLAQLFPFCRDIGLPVCTADLGLTPENRDAAIAALVEEVYGKRWNVANVPFFFSADTLADAIRYLDAYAAEQAGDKTVF